MTLINVKFSFCFIEENFTVYRDRVTLGTFLTFSIYPLISFYRIRKKGIIPHPRVQVSLMLLIVPLTTNLANVLLRSHDFELVQIVSAKKIII